MIFQRNVLQTDEMIAFFHHVRREFIDLSIQQIDQLRQIVRNSESVETWKPNHTEAWENAYQKLLTFLN